MQKVFIATGKVAHYIDPTAPLLPGVQNKRAPALCNIAPLWPGFWLKTEEAMQGENLPLCRTCETLMGVANARSA